VVLDPRPHLGVAPGVEGLPHRRHVGAVPVEEAEQLLGLQQGRRDTPAEHRRRGAHGVAGEHEPGQREGPVVAALTAVGVDQRSPDQHVGDRPGAVGVGPVRQAGDGPAHGVEGRRVPQLRQAGLVRRARDERGEDAALVREDDHLVAVEVGLPGDRVQQRPGLGAGVQLVLPAHVGDAEVPDDRRPRAQVPGHPTRPPGGVDDEVGG
jgi:hypothetical protein